LDETAPVVFEESGPVLWQTRRMDGQTDRKTTEMWCIIALFMGKVHLTTDNQWWMLFLVCLSHLTGKQKFGLSAWKSGNLNA
jgi:hypothetical protein